MLTVRRRLVSGFSFHSALKSSTGLAPWRLTLPSANAGTLSVRPALAGTAAGLGGALVMALGAVLSTGTALMVEVSPTPFALLTLLTGCVLLSLVAALVALRLERAATQGTAPRPAAGATATGLPDASRDA